MKTTSKTKTPAAASYAYRHTEAEGMLKRIAARLADHQRQQTAEPADWGYVGDLDQVTTQLAYVLASLGDTSAVEAKGLDY